MNVVSNSKYEATTGGIADGKREGYGALAAERFKEAFVRN